MNTRRLLTVVLAAQLAASIQAASAQVPAVQTQPATATAPAGDARNGRELYLRYSCYACHGYDGHGGVGARLVPMQMNVQGFTAYVRNPRQMPPYTATVLSGQQLADLWTCIRSLPASPAPTAIPLLREIVAEK